MQISPVSTHTGSEIGVTWLGQLYCGKCCTMARGNHGLIQPYMFEPESNSEVEE